MTGLAPGGADINTAPGGADTKTAPGGATETLFGADAAVRRESLQWTGLGIAALALAGVLALLLALARTPVIQDHLPWPWESFFHKALVTHVVLSVVVWFLAALGLLATLADGRARAIEGRKPWSKGLGRAATGLAAFSFLPLTAPALLDLGEPSLNNYVPVLDHPLYLAGLLALALAVALPCARLLAGLGLRSLSEPLVAATGAAALGYVVALVCFALGWILTGPMEDRREYFEWVFWGGGHVLQIVNALLMVGAWTLLAPAAWREGRIMAPLPFLGVMALAALVALAAPFLYAILDQGSGATYRAFTGLYIWGLAPVVGILGLAMARALWRARRALAARDPVGLALILSLLLFGLGGLYGFLAGYADTRTPAHYHASIGGVNLALMGLMLWLTPLLNGRRMPQGRTRPLMLGLYGGGQALHATGLFLAGLAGVARKTAGAEQGLDSLWKTASMGLMGLGGVIAVIGGVMFIILAGKSLAAGDAGNKDAGERADNKNGAGSDLGPWTPREDTGP